MCVAIAINNLFFLNNAHAHRIAVGVYIVPRAFVLIQLNKQNHLLVHYAQ